MLPAALPVAEDLRARMVPIAFRVARLCSAAQVLSGLGRSLGHVRSDLLPPFEEARDAVRRFHLSLRESGEAEATAILEGLGPDLERLRSLLSDLDRLCAPSELIAWIESEASVGADALARLVEFYAHERGRDADSIEKLVRVTRALIEREEADPAEPEAVLNALNRRYLLQTAEGSAPVPRASLVQTFRSLRARIEAIEREAEFDAAAAERGRLCDELGSGLCWPSGLALAVASSVWIERRKAVLARDQARPFANLLNDLEGVLDLAGETTPLQPLEDDDPEALQSLRRAEEEMRAAVANNTWSEAGFLLEVEEVEAILAVAEGRDSELQAAVLACCSCRAAVDRLARTHARGSAPAGQLPDPLPRGRALTYLREAMRIENQLGDLLQQAILRGDYTVAKSATRSAHKLSRARLGLALLGDLPVTGRHERADERASETPGADGVTETELRRELEVAKIVRDALLGDGRSDPVASGADARKEAVAGSAAASSSSGSAKRQALTPEQATRRRQYAMLGLLLVVSVITVCYHVANYRSNLASSPEIKGAEFAHAAPVARAIPVDNTFIVVATLNWESAGESTREDYVRRLWTDARQRGYHRMVVLNESGDRPLAVASEGSVQVLPVSGDLRYFAEQQRQR